MVALIPARAGSTRVPGKNMRLLHGVPLIAYSMAAAQQSGVFSDIQVWTDDPAVHEWVAEQQASVPYQRAPSAPDEPDIAWVRVWAATIHEPSYAILRPTSPFRTAGTIRRAFAQFHEGMDSLRAVEPWDGPHPGKMWYYDRTGLRLRPVLKDWTAHAPYHSSPTQSLVPVVRQNSSLEMAWTRNVTADIPTISGTQIAPFWTEGPEGFAIDTEADWAEAVQMADAHPEWLPPVMICAKAEQ